MIFYAGALPRMPSGFVIGTLCIIGQEPRTLDMTEMTILTSLRDLLLEELVSRSEPSHE